VALGVFGLVLILVAGLLVVFAVGGDSGTASGASSGASSTVVPSRTAGSRPSGAGASATAADGPSAASGVVAPTVHTPTDIPSSGRTLGNASAPVTVVVWEDYQCPPCGTWAANVMPQLTDTYVRPGKVKVVVHYLLVIDANVGGTESADSANAAMCAADQGKFWVYQDWLFANQGGEGSGAFSKVRLMEMGRQAGLDMAKLQPCVGNDTHLAEVQAESDSSDAQALPGVPSVSVNGQLLSSSDFATIAAAIDGVST
jgi:protein-disulfide isomerase